MTGKEKISFFLIFNNPEKHFIIRNFFPA